MESYLSPYFGVVIIRHRLLLFWVNTFLSVGEYSGYWTNYPDDYFKKKVEIFFVYITADSGRPLNANS